MSLRLLEKRLQEGRKLQQQDRAQESIGGLQIRVPHDGARQREVPLLSTNADPFRVANSRLPRTDSVARSTAASQCRSLDSHGGMPCAVPGLFQVLKAARLPPELLSAAAAWCDEEGAAELQEVAEEIEDFSMKIQLRPSARRRFEAALFAALRGGGTASPCQVSCPDGSIADAVEQSDRVLGNVVCDPALLSGPASALDGVVVLKAGATSIKPSLDSAEVTEVPSVLQPEKRDGDVGCLNTTQSVNNLATQENANAETITWAKVASRAAAECGAPLPKRSSAAAVILFMEVVSCFQPLQHALLALPIFDRLRLGATCQRLRWRTVAVHAGIPVSLEAMEAAGPSSFLMPEFCRILSLLLEYHLPQACPHSNVLCLQAPPSQGGKTSFTCRACNGTMVLSRQAMRALLPVACTTICRGEVAFRQRCLRLVSEMPPPDKIGTAVPPGRRSPVLGTPIVVDVRVGQACDISLKLERRSGASSTTLHRVGQQPPPPSYDRGMRFYCCPCCCPGDEETHGPFGPRTGRRKGRKGTRRSRLQRCEECGHEAEEL